MLGPRVPIGGQKQKCVLTPPCYSQKPDPDKSVNKKDTVSKLLKTPPAQEVFSNWDLRRAIGKCDLGNIQSLLFKFTFNKQTTDWRRQWQHFDKQRITIQDTWTIPVIQWGLTETILVLKRDPPTPQGSSRVVLLLSGALSFRPGESPKMRFYRSPLVWRNGSPCALRKPLRWGQ